MDPRKRYWAYFQQTYGQSIYLHKYRERTENIDRTISVVTAITSSASIAGWAIWKDFGWLWGFFIAISQVITATKGLLPYARRAELLRNLSASYARLATLVEVEWESVRSGAASPKKINDLLRKFKKEQNEIEDKLFSKTTLPVVKELLDQSAKDTKRYLEINYYV
jgi:hypothetical protein